MKAMPVIILVSVVMLSVLLVCSNSSFAESPEKISAIKVHVQTTHDDKDEDLWWRAEISDDQTVYGILDVGAGEVWRNDTTYDFTVNLNTAFEYANRRHIKIKIIQNTKSKNYGWEGWISVNGVIGSNNEVKLLDQTSPFKLGENGNPKNATFSFN